MQKKKEVGGDDQSTPRARDGGRELGFGSVGLNASCCSYSQQDPTYTFYTESQFPNSTFFFSKYFPYIVTYLHSHDQQGPHRKKRKKEKLSNVDKELFSRQVPAAHGSIWILLSRVDCRGPIYQDFFLAAASEGTFNRALVNVSFRFQAPHEIRCSWILWGLSLTFVFVNELLSGTLNDPWNWHWIFCMSTVLCRVKKMINVDHWLHCYVN